MIYRLMGIPSQFTKNEIQYFLKKKRDWKARCFLLCKKIRISLWCESQLCLSECKKISKERRTWNSKSTQIFSIIKIFASDIFLKKNFYAISNLNGRHVNFKANPSEIRKIFLYVLNKTIFKVLKIINRWLNLFEEKVSFVYFFLMEFFR